MRHTLEMSAKFLKSDLPNVTSQDGGRANRGFLHPRYSPKIQLADAVIRHPQEKRFGEESAKPKRMRYKALHQTAMIKFSP